MDREVKILICIGIVFTLIVGCIAAIKAHDVINRIANERNELYECLLK